MPTRLRLLDRDGTLREAEHIADMRPYRNPPSGQLPSAYDCSRGHNDGPLGRFRVFLRQSQLFLPTSQIQISIYQPLSKKSTKVKSTIILSPSRPDGHRGRARETQCLINRHSDWMENSRHIFCLLSLIFRFFFYYFFYFACSSRDLGDRGFGWYTRLVSYFVKVAEINESQFSTWFIYAHFLVDAPIDGRHVWSTDTTY